MTNARVARLLDSSEKWPAWLRLRGFSYGGAEAVEDREPPPVPPSDGGAGARLRALRWRLRRGEPPDVRRRLDWIQRVEPERSEREQSRRRPWSLRRPDRREADFALQPYTQLAGFYREQGRDTDSRDVAFERECRRGKRLGLAGHSWNLFLRFTVGHGYKPLRALPLLVVLIVFGTLLFSSFHSDGRLQAAKAGHPPFIAAMYTVDRLVPVVSLGLRDDFHPSGAAEWWAFLYTLVGWALTVAIVAGVTAAVRRE